MSDTETDPGYRSRSQSRRARRKKQASKSKQQSQQEKKNQKPFNMEPVEEDEDEPWTTFDSKPKHRTATASAQNFGPPASKKQAELHQKSNNSWAYQDAEKARKREADRLGMQPFEWIGPDQTSMNGPVTYARAMRGEIPMRPGNPNQSLETGYKPDQEGEDQKGGSPLMDKDGLKLRLELNLDIEIELKARIHGDITLSLMSSAC